MTDSSARRPRGELAKPSGGHPKTKSKILRIRQQTSNDETYPQNTEICIIYRGYQISNSMNGSSQNGSILDPRSR